MVERMESMTCNWVHHTPPRNYQMQALERTIDGFQNISKRGYKKKNKVFRRLERNVLQVETKFNSTRRGKENEICGFTRVGSISSAFLHVIRSIKQHSSWETGRHSGSFYATRSLATVLNAARHWTLLYANRYEINSHTHYFLDIHFNNILTHEERSPKFSLTFSFSDPTLVRITQRVPWRC